ncbi:MAG: (d)CMP kinase [Candidatus Micrarchaeia archaeon]
MRISIAGFTGAGKTTVAELLSKRLNVPHICFSFKDEARLRGMSLMELQILAAQNKRIDIEFDERQRERMNQCKDFVTSTWLGPWFANADLNVWLYAEDGVRAERVAKRDGISTEEALKNIRLRDQQNKERYLKLYNIKIGDINKFDICINTEKYLPNNICDIIMYAYNTRKNG